MRLEEEFLKRTTNVKVKQQQNFPKNIPQSDGSVFFIEKTLALQLKISWLSDFDSGLRCLKMRRPA